MKPCAGPSSSNEFDAGEPLTSRSFPAASRSAGPGREALAKLERDRLVRVVPKKGAFVRTVSADEIRELYQLREVLEALAIRLAAPASMRATSPASTRASGPWDGARPMRRCVRWARSSTTSLVKRSGNAKLMEMLEQIASRSLGVEHVHHGPRRAQALAKEHLAILDALKRPGPAGGGLMVAHVRRCVTPLSPARLKRP